MTLFGIIIFLVGWLYAISAFGLFLGLSLGWIPALINAWIAQLVLTGLVTGFVVLTNRGTRSAGGTVAARPAPSIGPALQTRLQRLGFRIGALLHAGVRWLPIAAGAIVLGLIVYFPFRNELNGQCDSMEEATQDLLRTRTEIIALNEDPDDLLNMTYGQVVNKYRHNQSEQRQMRSLRLAYGSVLSRFKWAEADLKWPAYCPGSHQDYLLASVLIGSEL